MAEGARIDAAEVNKNGGPSLRPALMLIGLVLAARLVYTIWACPYDLVEDEAQYWLWSRHLDWSYYSKGPGIAWAIWLSTRVFGHAEWAVRLPTVIAHALGALACAGLARDVARRAFVGGGSVATPARAAVFAGAAFMLAPVYQMTGVLATIDGSYLAWWALACWAAWRALCEGSFRAWLALGAAVGIGFLFKYTILLLLPGLIVFAVLNRGRLRMNAWWLAGFVCAAALVLLGLAPVVWWNAREGWPTVRHLLGHLGVAGGDMPVATGGDTGGGYNPLWTITYLLAPLGMFGPLLGLGAVAAMRILRRRQAATEESGVQRRLGAWFMVSCAAPILLFYLVVTFVAEPEQNWAIAGFVTVMVLAGWYGADELARRKAGAGAPSLAGSGTARTRPVKVLWRLSIIYGLCAAGLLQRADVGAVVMNRLIPVWGPAYRSVTGKEAAPIVPGRLIGAKVMAAHAGRVLDELEAGPGGGAGKPLVVSDHYGRASQMAYYLWRAGRSVDVFAAQSMMGGRRSQFDLWPETSLARADLVGRSALLMSNDKPVTVERWKRMFERVEPLHAPGGGQKLDGEHKKDRVAWIGTGFKGLPRE